MRIESERLYIYPIGDEEMEKLIADETDPELKRAYSEMLRGCIDHPANRIWYAVWNIELKNSPGAVVGDLSFKGLEADGTAEIGYGLAEAYRGRGYMTEAVKTVCRWALSQKGVKRIEAETEPGNTASQKVLYSSGFRPTGTSGREGPRFVLDPLYNDSFGGITMDKSDCVIRLERQEDHGEVENLIRESFWNVYHPGCSEHYVIHVLRNDPAFVKELDLVMEKDGRIIGQNMFMKTVIDADDGRTVPVLTMGPICITPELKRRGYGKLLLDRSLEKAAEMGFGAVLFEGNIGFYGKSGFGYARNFGIRYHDLPEGEDDSFFLCRELQEGYLERITGVYRTPAGYYVDAAEVEEFDRAFPPKTKLKLPGQLPDGR